MPDAIVIGAGPSGSLCGLLLSRGGWNVTLLEQQNFPRDKVCGECVSALGVEVLTRHGLLQPLLDRGALWLHQSQIYAMDGTPLRICLSRRMLGISRWALDAFLLEAAREAGVDVIQPARCEGIKSGAAATVRFRDLQSNRVQELTAPFVIVADGKSALPDGPPVATKDLGIKSHWEGIEEPRNAIQLFGFAEGYGGFSPIENGRWNAAFSISARRLRDHRGNIEVLFEHVRREQPHLDEKLVGAKRVTDWIASPLPRFSVRRNWPHGVIPVGNAAGAIEPIGGEGMGVALRSAELAADALLHSRTHEFNPEPLYQTYTKLWGMRQLLCRLGSLIAKSHWLAPATFDFLSEHDSLCAALLHHLGK